MVVMTPALLLAAALVSSQGQRGDLVTAWVERAATAGYGSAAIPPMNGRNVALVAVAIFESLNAITPKYHSYRTPPTSNPGASPDAATAAAARYLLVRLYPDQAKDLDAAFQAALATVDDGGARSSGVALGERVAAALLEERRADGASAANTYRPVTAAGTYVPTALPVVPAWGAVKPFAIKTGDQFRPAAPYELGSAAWAADYNEVKRLGAKTGSTRTAAQTEIARFWEFTGPSTYLPVARQVIAAKKLDQLESARVYALVTMAACDALVAVFDAKYTFMFWRPVTAIRNGDQDGNEATDRDAAWEPLIATPMHPEYPCAHCISQTAVASVLSTLYGDTVAFALTSPTAAGVTRRYARLSDYAAEVLNARIYDGVHYRQSGEVGAAMGRAIAAHIVEHTLRPLQ